MPDPVNLRNISTTPILGGVFRDNFFNFGGGSITKSQNSAYLAHLAVTGEVLVLSPPTPRPAGWVSWPDDLIAIHESGGTVRLLPGAGGSNTQLMWKGQPIFYVNGSYRSVNITIQVPGSVPLLNNMAFANALEDLFNAAVASPERGKVLTVYQYVSTPLVVPSVVPPVVPSNIFNIKNSVNFRSGTSFVETMVEARSFLLRATASATNSGNTAALAKYIRAQEELTSIFKTFARKLRSNLATSVNFHLSARAIPVSVLNYFQLSEADLLGDVVNRPSTNFLDSGGLTPRVRPRGYMARPGFLSIGGLKVPARIPVRLPTGLSRTTRILLNISNSRVISISSRFLRIASAPLRFLGPVFIVADMYELFALGGRQKGAFDLLLFSLRQRSIDLAEPGSTYVNTIRYMAELQPILYYDTINQAYITVGFSPLLFVADAISTAMSAVDAVSRFNYVVDSLGTFLLLTNCQIMGPTNPPKCPCIARVFNQIIPDIQPEKILAVLSDDSNAGKQAMVMSFLLREMQVHFLLRPIRCYYKNRCILNTIPGYLTIPFTNAEWDYSQLTNEI